MRNATKETNKVLDALVNFQAASALGRVRATKETLEALQPRRGTIAWNRTREAIAALARAERNLEFAEVE